MYTSNEWKPGDLITASRMNNLEIAVGGGYLAPEMHRNIYRGKNLGDHVTDEQVTAMRNGTFNDLFIGDYWKINSITWDIAFLPMW